jgi:GNAT superfamily N-acetyltransferase
MWWRSSASEFTANKGSGNKAALRALAAAETLGLLAYDDDGRPVGWCALGPRTSFPRLDRSRVLARVDDLDVWSVPCLFVQRAHRRKGVSVQLLEAASDFAQENGAPALEGYPTQPRADTMPDAFAWTGLPTAFVTAGFREILRRSPTRPIMRRTFARSAPNESRPERGHVITPLQA